MWKIHDKKLSQIKGYSTSFIMRNANNYYTFFHLSDWHISKSLETHWAGDSVGRQALSYIAGRVIATTSKRAICRYLSKLQTIYSLTQSFHFHKLSLRIFSPQGKMTTLFIAALFVTAKD